ncbi:MAG TPA: dockerin type I domain-containing protein [Vitreimonas sp.]|nr:dockerin type I domain-containing protein [Vitreimonas sp.]
MKKNLILSLVLIVTLMYVLLPVGVKAQAVPTACDADFNQDHQVNLPDYTIFLNSFPLSSATHTQADINHDGKTNLTDYSWFLLFLGQDCVAAPTPSPAASPSPSISPQPSPSASPSPTPIPSPSPSATPISGAPSINGCQIFPANNPWNTDISSYPVHANSASYIASIGANEELHPDFGGATWGETYGIPFITVTNSQALTPINFTAYGDESDPGPYPIPLTAPIEGGNSSDGDRHVIALNTESCRLYELYRAFPQSSSWNADSGAIFDLSSNALRPQYWTSADAAGLPILPGLVRYDEVAQGEIKHAIRFTVNNSQRAFIHPATHFASSSTNANLPPMGLRVRLKADYNINNLTGQARVIATALKKYGMILADNGSDWYISGQQHPNWNDEELEQLKSIPGSAFEAVETGPLVY